MFQIANTHFKDEPMKTNRNPILPNDHIVKSDQIQLAVYLYELSGATSSKLGSDPVTFHASLKLLRRSCLLEMIE